MSRSIWRLTFGTPEFDDALRLRYEVLRQPLGLEYTAEQIAAEYDQIHLGIWDASLGIIAYLNLTLLDEDTLKMRQVAVDPRLQGQGLGKALVEASERLALELGATRIYLHAREGAVPFYLGMGYQGVGEQFVEVGIPHRAMEKRLV